MGEAEICVPEDLLSPEEEEEEKEEEEETLETLKREIRLVRSVCSQHLILSTPPSPPCCDGGGRGTVKTDKATLYKRGKNLFSYCSVG